MELPTLLALGGGVLGTLAAVLLLGQRRSAPSPFAPEPAPLPLPPRDVAALTAGRDRLASAAAEPWLTVRATAWRARRRWFTDPAARGKLLSALAPGGCAPALVQGEKARAVEQWVLYLTGLADAAGEPELRPAVAALVGPWRGFLLDLRRAVRAERSRLGPQERAQVVEPAWVEELARLDSRAFPDTPYDFLSQPLDRALLERPREE
jgi:hypothetical protein